MSNPLGSHSSSREVGWKAEDEDEDEDEGLKLFSDLTVFDVDHSILC